MALKFAVIGCGGMGRCHSEGFKSLGGDVITMAACCDLVPEKAEAFKERFGYEKAYTDYKQMLKEVRPNLVAVTTWNAAHAPCTIDSLEAGANVFCEKPMAMNAAEAQAMKDTAERCGKVLQIGFVRRFGNDAAAAKKFIDQGILGDPVYARAFYLRRRGCPGTWFGDKTFSGGGPLIDIGVHVLDLARYLMGNPKPVSVFGTVNDKIHLNCAIAGSTSPWKTDDPGVSVYNVEDFVAGEIRFDNGACLHVETSYNMNLQAEANNVEIYGTKAGLMLNPLEIYTEMGERLLNIPVIENNNFTGDAYVAEDRHFVDCVLNGTASMASADDGLQAMKIIDALYESGRTGRSVQL